MREAEDVVLASSIIADGCRGIFADLEMKQLPNNLILTAPERIRRYGWIPRMCTDRWNMSQESLPVNIPD